MVPLTSLWVPILLAAVLVFLASFVAHMVLRHHRSDFRKLPAEDDVMDALRRFEIPPGDYMMPCGEGPESMKDPAFLEKMKQGPVALITVMRAGPPNMSRSLALWFVYCVVVGVFAAYVTGRTLAPGAAYLGVFRIAGTVAFVGYTLALWQSSIWKACPWSVTLKSTVDGLVYALLTAGAFGWLWPR